MRPCGETMYSGDHRKGLGLLATTFVLLVPIQQLFVRVVPIQQLFPCDHNPQSRGITGLLDMKRLLFALSLKTASMMTNLKLANTYQANNQYNRQL